MPVIVRRTYVLLRGWHLGAVACGLVVTTLLSPAFPPIFHLPHITQDQLVTPVAVLAAWGVSLLTLLTALEPASDLFLTAPSSTHATNLVRVLMVLTAGALLIAVTSDTTMLVPVSSGATFTGSGLVLAGLTGLESAWLAPTLHLMACMTLGNLNRADGLAVWAWPLEEEPGPRQLTVSTSLLAVGALTWHRSLRRPTREP